MAYVNQEKKAKIAAALKGVVPKDWKYSLAVRHHSTIVMTISKAPVDLLAAYKGAQRSVGYIDVNHYHMATQFEGDILEIFQKIYAALNLDNWDRSDSMTDYFDVGHYVDLNIGKWEKPFQVAA